MLKASTPWRSIRPAAVSRIVAALRAAGTGLTPASALPFGEVEVAVEVAVQIDHPPLFSRQGQMGEAGLMQATLKSGQHRNVLGQNQTRLGLVSGQPNV